MRLNPTEQMIYDEVSRKTMTVDDVAELVYRDRPRPPYWRSSISATMRYLVLKSSFLPRPIARVSPLGRGKRAEYGVAT